MNSIIGADPVIIEKFALLADLGIITVPGNYNNTKQLRRFRRWNSNISIPTTIPSPTSTSQNRHVSSGPAKGYRFVCTRTNEW